MTSKFVKAFQAILAVTAVSALGTSSAWATGGCLNSPENPTLLLGLLGGAAAGLPWLKAQIAARRGKRTESETSE